MALAVQAWPALQLHWDDALLVLCIGHPDGTTRASARARIRAALGDALAQTLGIKAGQVTFDATPGNAPRLLIGGAACTIGVSISHAGNLSLAAVNRIGAVGVDLMAIDALPDDWQRVAGDYLGMTVAGRLGASAPARRGHAFAQAWAEREAHLKLLGLPLAEWTPLPGECRWRTLALPAGFAGALATQHRA